MEEARFENWFRTYAEQTIGLSAYRSKWEWPFWLIALGLHRRDTCTVARHHHAEDREADLPRSRWLSIRAAMVMAEEQPR